MSVGARVGLPVLLNLGTLDATTTCAAALTLPPLPVLKLCACRHDLCCGSLPSTATCAESFCLPPLPVQRHCARFSACHRYLLRGSACHHYLCYVSLCLPPLSVVRLSACLLTCQRYLCCYRPCMSCCVFKRWPLYNCIKRKCGGGGRLSHTEERKHVESTAKELFILVWALPPEDLDVCLSMYVYVCLFVCMYVRMYGCVSVSEC